MKKSKKSRQTNKLPQKIYGHWHEEGTSDQFLRTDECPECLVENGETLKVGVYELVGYAEVKNATQVTALDGSK
ncbi:MAG TPA: hypothetical protein VGN72_01210 [Tepidisphaeraceae bacterium]|jgi:hypothetical protein|nr:hypothetical protein [Tepidisphaeraceae bacterium]